MKKLLFYTEILILSVLLWIILNEDLSFITVFLGTIVGIISIFVVNNVLNIDDYNDIFKLSPIKIFKFFIYLIIQIYSSGITTIGKIITGKINPDIIEIDTCLDSDLEVCILANAITLTPGTVTVDKKGTKLKILWLDSTTKDKEIAGTMIKKKFEKILN